jgi:transcriptional regulator with XRE-family HTH domain
MSRISVKPALLTWARERAQLDTLDLPGRFPKLAEWEGGERQPTLRQLQDFARAVHVPIGYLFLPEPPQESLPVPDFRTLTGREVTRPSPNLLDTLYLCQQRQEWFRDYARWDGLPPASFVGSARLDDDPIIVAEKTQRMLTLSATERAQLPTWTDALRQLIAKVACSPSTRWPTKLPPAETS